MMSTKASSAPTKAATTKPIVSFSNEDETGGAGDESYTHSNHDNKFRLNSLSQSAKAWDIDGDGKLSEAEMALKNMDKSKEGALSKEQLLELMQENLKSQRDLFKAKKVIIGLVVFACVLALSNLGTSFAAVFLAKDTTVTDGKLTDTTTGEVIRIETAMENYVIDPKFNEEQKRRRMSSRCHDHYSGPEIINCIVPGDFISKANGLRIMDSCISGKTVNILKSMESIDVGYVGTAQYTICSQTNTKLYRVNGCDWMEVYDADRLIFKISPAEGSEGDDTHFQTLSLRSGTNQVCGQTRDCVANHQCEIYDSTQDDVRPVCLSTPLVCKKNEGQICTSTDECIATHCCKWANGVSTCQP